MTATLKEPVENILHQFTDDEILLITLGNTPKKLDNHIWNQQSIIKRKKA